jgi:type II secretory pathway predicted ATPase ExeA
MKPEIINPFRPGAGHTPPYLAGRTTETERFLKLLDQNIILNNVALTGLRGVGKTVLLEAFKPLALKKKWLWVGTDFSESAGVSEETLAQRLLTDLSVATSAIKIKLPLPKTGLLTQLTFDEKTLDYVTLVEIYKNSAGLVSDRIKTILELVWAAVQPIGIQGIVFAYDEAQTMSDHADKEQYPLSVLLDVFQSIQKKEIPFLMVLAGLPTLFPKLVATRTFSERMFDVIALDKLDKEDSRQAIVVPIEKAKKSGKCPITFDDNSVDLIYKTSGGYPYFIQFICKEIFDVFLQQIQFDGKAKPVPINEIVQKLDKNFFAGRWAKSTDRQRELLSIIATLDNCDDEFSIQDIVAASKFMATPFGASHINQMLSTLSDAGLIYKNRHGKYSFAVPLLGKFILRQEAERTLPLLT